jgi:hypothetical protein
LVTTGGLLPPLLHAAKPKEAANKDHFNTFIFSPSTFVIGVTLWALL